jgi:hypothetical protein
MDAVLLGKQDYKKWANEGTSEELWVLVALKEGWPPPDAAIERAVWRRVTGIDEEVDLEPSHKHFTF